MAGALVLALVAVALIARAFRGTLVPRIRQLIG